MHSLQPNLVDSCKDVTDRKQTQNLRLLLAMSWVLKSEGSQMVCVCSNPKNLNIGI